MTDTGPSRALERTRAPGLPESEICGVLTTNADSWDLPRPPELDRRVRVCIFNKVPPSESHVPFRFRSTERI